MIDEDQTLEDDEEEILVYVDFDGMSGLNTFCDEKLELDMIGIDSEHPIMCVNGKYYEGTYEDAVGTYMFFENIEPVIEDPVFDKTASLKYCAKAKKILKMSRVFVKPRYEVLGDSNHPGCIPNMDTIKAAGVPPRYQKDALSLWEAMRNERLEALSEYLEKQRQREQKRKQGIELDSESDDDNPFAMYKPTAQELDENPSKSNKNEKNSKTPAKSDPNALTIIDPGPSTSKDSVAWLDPVVSDSSNNLTKSKPTANLDSGYIQIPEKREPRKNTTKKKRKKVAQSIENSEKQVSELTDSVPNNEVSETINDSSDGQSMTVANIANHTEDDGEKSVKQVNDGIAKIMINDSKSSTNEEILNVSDITATVQMDQFNKKIEKQRKREAKMHEISERLKKYASEMDTK